jgi:ATP-dependent exoDNAse (exonuclease V) beta subunit
MTFTSNTVVWASAGTGKTRKLVEVYIELLEQGIDPMRIAAVTFTEKAAAEMRDRIRAALYAKPGQWMKTLALLPAAPISTIHGFCGMLIREHGFELGIDPSFSILDEQRSLDLARESARDTIRQEIRSGNEEVESLFGDFGLEALVETLISASYWLSGLGVGDDWLDERIQAQRLAAAQVERELAREIQEYGSDFERIGELADELEAKKARHSLRKRDDPAALLPRIGQSAGVAAAERLSRLLKICAERFRARKRAANAMDFDDLLLGARDLLKNHPAIRRHYQNHFQSLLVDEFQDTDEVQAEIISLLAEDAAQQGRLGRRKLIIVGDPKQSISRTTTDRRRPSPISRTCCARSPWMGGERTEPAWRAASIFRIGYGFRMRTCCGQSPMLSSWALPMSLPKPGPRRHKAGKWKRRRWLGF